MSDARASTIDVGKPRTGWPRLTLGTVQFGYPYGISQSSIPREDVRATLSHAWDRGIDMLDTAPAYGDSEAIIGEVMPAGARFKCITKTAALRLKTISLADVDRVMVGARSSAANLQICPVDAILVHESEDLLCPGSDHLMAGLRRLCEEGVVRRVGVSVYDPETLDTILERHEIDIVQLPLNVFDQRFIQNRYLAGVMARGVEIHVRSVFLQGVLLQSPNAVSSRFSKATAPLSRFHEYINTLGLSPVEAAILFAASQDGVSRLVIGIDNVASLETDIRALEKAKSFPKRVDFSQFAIEDPQIIDPRRWTL
jgi:aryl-alcohol dehydrogenase-like predicted oxidoreductase